MTDVSSLLHRYAAEGHPSFLVQATTQILSLPSPCDGLRQLRKTACASSDPAFLHASLFLVDQLLSDARVIPEARLSLPVMLNTAATAFRSFYHASPDPVNPLSQLLSSWRERKCLDEMCLHMCGLALAPGTKVPPPPSPSTAATAPPAAPVPSFALPPSLSSDLSPPQEVKAAVVPAPAAVSPAPLPVSLLLQQQQQQQQQQKSTPYRPLISEAQDLEAMPVGLLVNVVRAHQAQSQQHFHRQGSVAGPLIGGSAVASITASEADAYVPIDASRLPSLKATSSVEPGRLEARLAAFQRDLAFLMRKVENLKESDAAMATD